MADDPIEENVKVGRGRPTTTSFLTTKFTARPSSNHLPSIYATTRNSPENAAASRNDTRAFSPTRLPDPNGRAATARPASPSPPRPSSSFNRSAAARARQPTLVLNSASGSPDFYWLYGWLEYKRTDDEATARARAYRQIDQLVARLARMGPTATCIVLFDIIATRKHIRTAAPHRLGADIYRYVDSNYLVRVRSTFVGLSDNTSRRVARDVFCRSTALSRRKWEFDVVDDVHMFVLYPPAATVPYTDRSIATISQKAYAHLLEGS